MPKQLVIRVMNLAGEKAEEIVAIIKEAADKWGYKIFEKKGREREPDYGAIIQITHKKGGGYVLTAHILEGQAMLTLEESDPEELVEQTVNTLFRKLVASRLTKK